jgi:TonB family protein
MKFKSHVILVGWLLFAHRAAAEQFVVSGSGGHPGLTDDEATRNIKISVSSKNKVSVNGSQGTLDNLDRALKKFAEQKGEIWYHKNGPKVDPSYEESLTTAILFYVDSKLDPVGIIVLTVAADNHLPVRFSSMADFSDGNVREIQNSRDIILSSPAPKRPASEKHGGGGVFRQHINRETGEVISVTIKQSTRHPALDRCAVEALRQWKYKPSTKFDTIAIPISFAGDGWTIKK